MIKIEVEDGREFWFDNIVATGRFLSLSKYEVRDIMKNGGELEAVIPEDLK